MPQIRFCPVATVLSFLVIYFLAIFSQAEELRLALNWKPEPQFGGFYAADKNFKSSNIKMTLMPGGSGTPTVQMLAAGQTEYAIVSADELVLAHDRGAKDLVAIFAVFQTNPQGLMFRSNKNYDSIESLLKDKNSILLWQAGLPYVLFLQKKWGRPQTRTAPHAGGISAMLADPKINQQCFVTSEPLLAKKKNLDVKSFLIADSGYNPYTTVVVTSRKRWLEKPEEVKQVTAAIRQGWVEYLKNPKPTHLMMNKLNPSMDLETMNESALAQKPLIETADTLKAGLGAMSLERWTTLVDQLIELKLLKTKPSAQDLFLNPGEPALKR